MPTISAFYGIIIRMFYRDRAPAHFHVEYAEHKATIGIETLGILEGSIPRRTLSLVLEWAVLHRQELRANWLLCRRHKQPNRIDPLE